MSRSTAVPPTAPRPATSAGGAEILVVEDSAVWQQLVTTILTRAGHHPTVVGSAADALDHLRHGRPEVILLDLGLPDGDGIELCREIRGASDAHILILSAKDTEMDRVLGLTVGADDYVTKPFSERELLARVQAVLRRRAEQRPAPPATTRRVHDGMEVDPEGRIVEIDGRRVELTRIEFDLVDALTERPQMVWTRDQLLERVWGPDHYGAPNLVDTHIGNLRRKVDPAGGPSRITTVRGVGYRLAG
jgi:DNA-binding response OmpR family regulator